MSEPQIRLTRRRLMASGGAAALSMGLVGGVAVPRAAAAGSWLSRRSHAARVGQAFTARPPGGPTTGLKLAGVEDLAGTSRKGTSLAGRDDAFALRFARTSGPDFPQGPVELRHRQLGRTTLFLVPGGDGSYALVVNRTP